VISAHDPLVLQHAAKALSTLLRQSGKSEQKPNLAPLIERIAEVPDLPRKHITLSRSLLRFKVERSENRQRLA